MNLVVVVIVVEILLSLATGQATDAYLEGSAALIMSFTYKLFKVAIDSKIGKEISVIRSDGWCIPFDEANTDVPRIS